MPRNRVKRFALAVAVVFLLAVIGYASVFNSITLTRLVLPALSTTTEVRMSARQLSYNPFTGKVWASGISIGPAEAPWVEAEEATFIYDATALRQNEILFSDIWIRGGVFSIRHEKEDTEFYTPPQTSAPAADEDSNELKFSNITVTDSVLNIQWKSAGKSSLLTISEISGSVEKFQHGSPFNGNLSGNITLAGNEENKLSAGRINMTWHNKLQEDYFPEKTSVKLRLDNLQGYANGEQFENVALEMNFSGHWEKNHFSADQILLHQTMDGELRSTLDFSGMITPDLGIAKGKVQKGKLSPEIIALACDFFYGINPGTVWLDYSGKFSLTPEEFSAAGKFHIQREGDIRISSKRLPLPAMTFDGEHDFKVLTVQNAIDLSVFKITASSQEKTAASLLLREPVKYIWEEKENAAGEGEHAVFDLRCDGLDIHLLKFIMPQSDSYFINSGKIFNEFTLRCRSNLSAVDFSGSGSIRKLSWKTEQQDHQLHELQYALNGSMDKNFSVKLEQADFVLETPSNKLAEVSLTGQWNRDAPESIFSLQAEKISPELYSWYTRTPLPPLPAEVTDARAGLRLSGTFSNESRILNIQTLSLSFPIPEKSELNLSVSPFSIDFAEEKALDHIPFELNGNGKTALAALFLPPDALPALTSGDFLLTSTGTLAKDCSWIQLDGTLKAEKLGWNELRDINLESRFSCSLNEMNLLDIKMADLYVICQGRPALRLECPGKWEFRPGSYLGNWKLRYLNDKFLRIFLPMEKTETNLSGDIQLTLNEKKQKLVAAMECTDWKQKDAAPLSGKTSFVLEKTQQEVLLQRLELQLQQEKNPLFELSGEGKWLLNVPLHEGASLQLHSRLMNIPQLAKFADALVRPSRQQEDAAPYRQAVTAARPELPRLNMTHFPGTIDLEIENCSFSPELKAGIKTVLAIQPEKLSAENFTLQLNDSSFTGTFSLGNESGGILMAGTLKGGEKPFALRPFAEFMLNHSLEGLQGSVSNVETTFSLLNDGGEGGWLNAVNGTFNADFRELLLPSTLNNGPFGKLLLFPVDVVAHAVGFLPNDLESWKARFSPQTAYSSVGILRFDQGNVRLRSTDGKVAVDYCRFLGPSVKRLTFEGEFDLRDQQNVDLRARISAVGGQMLIPIAGTISEPQLNWAAIATDPAVEALRKIGNLKLIGLNHQLREDDEPLIILTELPGVTIIKHIHQLFTGWL